MRNPQHLIVEFLRYYYGAAANQIESYIKAIEAVRPLKQHISLYSIRRERRLQSEIQCHTNQEFYSISGSGLVYVVNLGRKLAIEF